MGNFACFSSWVSSLRAEACVCKCVGVSPSRTSLFIKIILKWKAGINLILSHQTIDSVQAFYSRCDRKRRQEPQGHTLQSCNFYHKTHLGSINQQLSCAGCASFVHLHCFTGDFCHHLSVGLILSVSTFFHSKGYQHPFLGTLSPSFEVFGDGLGRDGSPLSV